MGDAECVRFLQWALERMGFRWPGFRRVRTQVCKRIARRWRELGLADLESYRRYLDTDRSEWSVLDGLCRITISRFYRDRGVFEDLKKTVLPAIARLAAKKTKSAVRIWSCGCGAGEEPYSLRLAWGHLSRSARSGLDIEIVGTDTDSHQLERAGTAIYPESSLRELPDHWMSSCFAREPSGELRLDPGWQQGITFLEQDLRRETPEGDFDLILCRNLAFTYFEEPVQRQVLARLVERLRSSGAFVIGSHEELPGEAKALAPWEDLRSIFRRSR